MQLLSSWIKPKPYRSSASVQAIPKKRLGVGIFNEAPLGGGVLFFSWMGDDDCTAPLIVLRIVVIPNWIPLLY